MRVKLCFVTLWSKILNIMNTSELKKSLIDIISELDDSEILNRIKALLENDKKADIIDFTPEQEEELRIARQQAKEGLFVTQDELDKKVRTNSF